MVASVPLVPTFVRARAAKGYERRNRDTSPRSMILSRAELAPESGSEKGVLIQARRQQDDASVGASVGECQCMSTPLEKPPGPIDLSAYAQKARERAVAEQYPSGTDDHPPRSPYAPKRARERGSPGQHSLTAVGLDAPDICPGDAPDGGDDAPNLAFEPGAADPPVDLYMAASLQPAPGADSRRSVPLTAEPRDASATDYDLERLEASLRWLQRQEAAARLARTAQPPPRRAPALLDARDRRLSGERFVERFRSPLSLEPERLAPPQGPRRNLRAPLAILVASIFTASAIYYFFVVGSAPSSAPGPAPQMASAGSRAAAPTPTSTSSGQPERRP